MRRRKLTQDDLERIEWWECGPGWFWKRDIREYGYAVTPDEPAEIPEADRRVALLCEMRWIPAPPTYVPSRLWDQPFHGVSAAYEAWYLKQAWTA